MDLVLDKKMVFRNLKLNKESDVLNYLSTKLYENGYVKKEYIDAIQLREKEYPTGLPSTNPAIAIPHANYELVNKTTLAIATLTKPVPFHNMEKNEEMIDVQIVIMMAIGEPHGQIEMLQKIVGIIQDEVLRKKMVEADTDDNLLSLLEKVVA